MPECMAENVSSFGGSPLDASPTEMTGIEIDR